MDMTAESGARLLITLPQDPNALSSLHAWLQREDELRGRLRMEGSAAASETSEEMGGLLDVLSIAVGSGGAGAVLARSLSTWLSHRHTELKVNITAPDGRSLEVDARVRDTDVPGLISEIRELADGPEQRR
ncbi:effector-associated constant component EACC1 [Streptomyces sp. NPDC055897]